jgi:hypothetical protein
MWTVILCWLFLGVTFRLMILVIMNLDLAVNHEFGDYDSSEVTYVDYNFTQTKHRYEF